MAITDKYQGLTPFDPGKELLSQGCVNLLARREFPYFVEEF